MGNAMYIGRYEFTPGEGSDKNYRRLKFWEVVKYPCKKFLADKNFQENNVTYLYFISISSLVLFYWNYI